MANNEFPHTYDAIILGTGLPESILAAALARNGYQVLHLDRNSYYGGTSAVLSFDSLRQWAVERQCCKCSIKVRENFDTVCCSLVESHEKLVGLSLTDSSVSNVEEVSYLPIGCSEGIPPLAVTQDGGGCGVGASCSPKSDSSVNACTLASQSEDARTSNGQQLDAGTALPNEKDCESRLSRQQDETAPCITKAAVGTACWTLEKLLTQSRQFNLDLCPKVLYGSGEAVQLLISSDVARYCEFKAVTRVLSLAAGSAKANRGCAALESVPCGRSDIFNSRKLSMIEKRILMKFLTESVALTSGTNEVKDKKEEPDDVSIVEFLQKKGCTSNLSHFLVHSVAMVPEASCSREALRSMRKFLLSSGRYGPTPFLWPMYGGELSQAFCRLSAVFGGVYVLNRIAHSFIMDSSNSYCGIICNEGMRLKSRWLIMDASYLVTTEVPATSAANRDSEVSESCASRPTLTKRLSHAILITDRSILPSNGVEVTILVLSAADCGFPSTSSAVLPPTALLELPHEAAVCPTGLYIVHLTTSSYHPSAREDFLCIINDLFTVEDLSADDSSADASMRPRVLWSLFYNQLDYTSTNQEQSNVLVHKLPANVYITKGLGAEVDYDAAVSQARTIFSQLCPTEEFLPRPPQQEDIIFCDDENKEPSNSEFASPNAPEEESSSSTAYVPPQEESSSSTAYVFPQEESSSSTAYVPPQQESSGSTAYVSPEEESSGSTAYVSPQEESSGFTAYVPPHEESSSSTAYVPPQEESSSPTSYAPPEEDISELLSVRHDVAQQL